MVDVVACLALWMLRPAICAGSSVVSPAHCLKRRGRTGSEHSGCSSRDGGLEFVRARARGQCVRDGCATGDGGVQTRPRGGQLAMLGRAKLRPSRILSAKRCPAPPAAVCGQGAPMDEQMRHCREPHDGPSREQRDAAMRTRARALCPATSNRSGRWGWGLLNAVAVDAAPERARTILWTQVRAHALHAPARLSLSPAAAPLHCPPAGAPIHARFSAG